MTRTRWVADHRRQRLHAVTPEAWDAAAFVADVDVLTDVNGTRILTLCQQPAPAVLPGGYSRSWLARCPECCAVLGIPAGMGVMDAGASA